MSHVRRSDWAAAVPWAGILDKPAGTGEATDIGQLTGSGFVPGDVPSWNGSKFVPSSGGGGGGGGGPSGILQLDSPGVATKRIKPGTTQFEYVWLRETYDVRQYGADPTGSGDSTDSFNAAISALNSGGGGSLVVPAGRYRISSALNRILARCWVQGAGQGAVIIEATGDVFWVTSGSFFGASGLTLIGSSDGATGIRIEDSASTDNFLLSDLRVSGFGFALSVNTVARSGWIQQCRLEATRLALLLTASDSFVSGVSIYNGGDNTRNGFEMTGYRNQVSDFKILGDASNFKKGLFVNDGGNHVISGGMIIGCDEEAISLSNGTGGVTGCRVQNISWLTIGTDPDVVSYDPTTNWVDDLYEIGTSGAGGASVVLVAAPTDSSDPGADNQIANDGTYFYSYAIGLWKRVAMSTFFAFPLEYTAWRNAVIANGGTFGANSEAWALALIVALESKSYSAKVVYLLPLLGSNLNAAVVPLRDSIGAGNATNHNFVGGDFNEAQGLQGDGSTKYLDSNVKPSQLGTGSNGGLGWWENNQSAVGANTEPIGCYSNAGTERYVLDLRSTVQWFSWSNAGNRAQLTTARLDGHYYGSRSSSTSRKYYFGGVLEDTNTTADAAAGASDRNILICGSDESGSIVPYGGRCAVAYMTDGTMSDADATDFDTLLSTYLIGPTGR